MCVVCVYVLTCTHVCVHMSVRKKFVTLTNILRIKMILCPKQPWSHFQPLDTVVAKKKVTFTHSYHGVLAELLHLFFHPKPKVKTAIFYHNTSGHILGIISKPFSVPILICFLMVEENRLIPKLSATLCHSPGSPGMTVMPLGLCGHASSAPRVPSNPYCHVLLE